jgi:hypothetical protein
MKERRNLNLIFHFLCSRTQWTTLLQLTQGENIVQTNHFEFVFLMYVFEKGKDSVESEKRRKKNQPGSSLFR